MVGLDGFESDEVAAILGLNDRLRWRDIVTRAGNDGIIPRTLADYLALPYRMKIAPVDHGGYVVNYPDLLGRVTQVDALDDAIAMGREVLTGWLEIVLEDGDDIALTGMNPQPG